MSRRPLPAAAPARPAPPTRARLLAEARVLADAAAILAPRNRRRAPVAPLEDRRLLSVTYDANGYTVVSPSSDSRVVYVSSSAGSDGNSGLSPLAPVASIAKAQTLMRSGMPDEMLLRRGDVFHGVFNVWSISGRSVQEPLLISAYGTGARPEVDPGTATAAFLSSSTAAVSYVDIIGIGFDPLYRDPASPTFNPAQVGGTTGIRWYCPGGGNILVEDCSFNYFKLNLDVEYGSSNFTVRRCVVDNSWATTQHSEGIYANGVSNVTIEDSVFDHNGWLAGVGGAGQQGFNHDMYFASNTTGMVVQDNVIANASFAGIMARSGGVIDGNLFVNDPIALVYGDANGADSTAGGVTGQILNNVLSGTGTFSGSPYGQGFEIGNTKPGAGLLVAGNVFDGDTQLNGPAITFTYASDTLTPTVCVGVNDVTVANNVFNGFSYTVQIDGRLVPGTAGLTGLTDLKIVNNDLVNAGKAIVRDDGAIDPTQELFSGNRYYDANLSQANWARIQTVPVPIQSWLGAYDTAGSILPALPYADPSRTSATYDAATGGPGTAADFLAQAEQVSASNYRPQYGAQAVLNYVTAGYGTDTAPPAVTAVTLPQIGPGATAGTVTVTYADNFLLNAATVGTGDLLVTGPGGFSYAPTLSAVSTVAVLPSGGQSVTATYAIAPAGWADGTYAVTLLPGAVADAAGNASALASLGTFAVDLTPPTVTAVVAPTVTTADPTAPAYTFAVTYADPSGIALSSLDSNQVQVASLTGFAQTAALVGVTSTATTATATYAVAPPAGGWTAANNGTYVLTLAGDPVRDTVGNALASAALGSFAVAVQSLIPAASVAGHVYVDANANGTRDPREVGLAGVTVFVDLAGTGTYAAGDPTAVTAADGSYGLAGLPAGTYTLLVVPPAGYSLPPGRSASLTVTLGAGGTVTSADFGLQVTPLRVSATPHRGLPVGTLVAARA